MIRPIRWAREARRTAEVVTEAAAAGMTLQLIRSHLAALGIPTEHLTDEALEKTVIDFGRAVAGAGIPWTEALDVLQVGISVVRNAGEPASEWLKGQA